MCCWLLFRGGLEWIRRFLEQTILLFPCFVRVSRFFLEGTSQQCTHVNTDPRHAPTVGAFFPGDVRPGTPSMMAWQISSKRSPSVMAVRGFLSYLTPDWEVVDGMSRQVCVIPRFGSEHSWQPDSKPLAGLHCNWQNSLQQRGVALHRLVEQKTGVHYALYAYEGAFGRSFLPLRTHLKMCPLSCPKKCLSSVRWKAGAGHKDAEYVIVVMGSGAVTCSETATYLQEKGEKVAGGVGRAEGIWAFGHLGVFGYVEDSGQIPAI